MKNTTFKYVLIVAVFGLIALNLHLSLLVNKTESTASVQDAILTAAQSSLDKPGHPPFPQVALDRPTHGEEAIAKIGSKLPEVAHWYGYTEEELISLFKRDHTLWTDERGKMFYKDENTVLSPQPADPISGQTLSPEGGLFPLEQTFSLHSRPGSSKIIYLDFNGQTFLASQSIWAQRAGGTDLIMPPWDLDGSPLTFGDTERTAIQKVWQRVAEDYAPFDVDVTTEEPTADRLSRSSQNDIYYGNRALISPTTKFGAYGGYSYFSTFDDTSEYSKSSLCFPNYLANNEKYIAECVSHEIGHSLNLSHDGNAAGEYYYGQGIWAPIMGSSYYKAVSQFSKGDYTGANNKQDDLAVMNTFLAYMSDDYGNSISSASPITVSGGNISASGFIEKNTDMDFFTFNSSMGTTTINVKVATLSPNLDVEATLYDATGKVLLTANPSTMGATLSGTLSGGTYYLSVKGVGAGDLTTGYSNYGSLGQYYITGTIPVNTSINQPPVAAASASPLSGSAPLAVTFGSSGSADPEGGALTYYWNFGDGTNSSEPNPAHTYTTTGTFNVNLTVTDIAGYSNTKSISINVINKPPVASFTANTSSNLIPATYSFDATASTDPDGPIASYSWNFGDNTTGTGVTTSHTYEAAGTFPITLTVKDSGGLASTKSLSVTVVDPNVVNAPSNLTVSSAGNVKGAAVLNWTDNSQNEDSFYVERAPQVRQGSLNYQRIATLEAGVTTYKDSLSSGSYYYRVQAYSAALNKTSIYSGAVSVRVK
jgi:PKD repeat protein